MIDDIDKFLRLAPDPSLLPPPQPDKVDVPRDWPGLFERGIALVRRIVPELTCPIYVLTADEVKERDLGTILSMTGQSVDLSIKPLITDRWRGRGVGIIVNTALCDDIFWSGMREETIIAKVIVHEIVHGLAGGWALTRTAERDDYSPLDLAVLEKLSEVVNRGTWFRDEDTGGNTVREFLSHDDRFLRCGIHLAHRLGVEPGYVIGFSPELTAPEDYAAILHDECERLSGAPLQQILDSQPPEDFTLLWAYDLRRFHKRRVAAKQQREDHPMFVLEKLNDILSKVSNRFREKEVADGKRFADLIRKLADGKDLNPDVVGEILQATGKTPDDLHREVKKIVDRRQLLQTVKRGNAVAAERAELDQQEAGLTQPIEVATRAYHEALPAIQQRRRELELLDRQAAQARSELAASCADETLHAELETLKTERAEIDAKMVGYERDRKAVLAEAARKENETTKAGYDSWNDPEQLEKLVKKSSAAEHELAEQLKTNIDAGRKACLANAAAQEAVQGRMAVSPI
jgi:hypothetical protein